MKESQGKGQPADVQMPFTSHLEELRSRLIKSCLAVAVAFFVCFALAEEIFQVLVAPLRAIQTPGLTVIGTGVTEAFFTKIKVSFVAGIMVALPVLLWQGWHFVAPGLYEYEKRYTRNFVLFGSFFFLAGAAFCYEVVFRFGLSFLLQKYEVLEVQPYIRMGEYLSFVSRLILAFGVTFQLPVIAYFLARIGMIDHHFLIHHFGYALIVIAILAAILTPPDLVSQVLLMFPLCLLYGVSIGVAYLARRKR